MQKSKVLRGRAAIDSGQPFAYVPYITILTHNVTITNRNNGHDESVVQLPQNISFQEGWEMACCKAEEYGWCKDLQVVDYRDDEGNEYCIFHAPQGEKGVSLEAFNELVFERINAFKGLPEEEKKDEVCDFSGAVFEGDIDFREFEFPAIYFRHATFKDVNFSEATFLEADFRKASFREINFSQATFSETNFRHTTFTEANFNNAVFAGKTDFGKAIFLGKSNFSKAVFSGKVSFNRVDFSGETQFKKTTFSGEVYLSRASFSGKVSFSNATFLERASFGNATFSEIVHFSTTRFSEGVNFRSAMFLEKAHFNETIFGKNVSFKRATFNEEIFFGKAIFSGIANFSSVMFAKRTYFGKSAFSDQADFRRVTFSGEALFGSTTFSGETLFNNATFSEEARFRCTIFSGETRFKKVTFSGETQFNDAKFSGNAFFGNAIFSGRIDFNRAEFINANFTHATFQATSVFAETSFKAVSFHRSTIREAIYFETLFLGRANFSRVVIEDKMKFQNVDAGRISFLESDIRACDFVNCTWDKVGERYCLYDEVKLLREENPSIDDIRKVESLYRALKRKSGENHNQHDYSLWHLSEKEMLKRRTYFTEKPCLWALIRLYSLVSGYGEDFKRGLWGLVTFVLLAFVILGLIGFEPVNKDNGNKKEVVRLVRPMVEINDYNPFPHWYAKGEDVGTVAITTLEYLTFFKSVDMRPHGLLGRFVLIVFRILIPIQAALFGMALRNRLRR